ncbi:hypothetical protein CIB95_11855 [Lottiidibacillus patelloidae]|uniref:WG repeat-containing protein n=1 Tax=Lottiidibacillus patelloidae TaxID=2670334 RepID=A0A263BRX0_9BACI|nr:WG repeat-containing protein [Lottiidibacillus patelloidae]OZM56463.1 hypothetical protein CIB95_11855 [Lottiidibacillus patelloidae]
MTLYTGMEELIPIEFEHLYLPAKHYIIAGKNNKFGVLNYNNEVIVPFEYEHILMNIPNTSLEYMVARKGEKYGVISYKGEVLLPFIYEEAHTEEDFDNLILVKVDNKWGYINLKQEEVIPPIYDEFFESLFPKEHGRIATKNGKQGIISAENKVIIPFEYEEIQFYSDKYLVVKKNNKWGLIDKIGEVVIPAKYDAVKYHPKASTFVVKQNEKWFHINQNGEVKSAVTTDDSSNQKTAKVSYSPVIKAYLSRTGKIKISLLDKLKSRLKNQVQVFSFNNRYGLLNQKGQIIVQPNYAAITYKHYLLHDIARVIIRENGKDKYGLIRLIK